MALRSIHEAPGARRTARARVTTSPTKLLVLGIDAASPALVDEWIADGTLPNLAALAKRGLSGARAASKVFSWARPGRRSTPAPIPRNTAFTIRYSSRPGAYRLEDRALGAFVERDPFWRVLSRAGKRVAVLDVPLAKLEPELNGIQVVEWGGHDSLFGYSTMPPELAADIESRFGRHPVGTSCDVVRRSAAELS